MPSLEQGTVVAVDKCPDCGHPVQIKLNKNRNAYMTCKHQNADTFNICMAHRRWGRDVSQKFQEAYVASRKAAPAQITKQDTPENDQTVTTTPADGKRDDTGVQVEPERDDRADWERLIGG